MPRRSANFSRIIGGLTLLATISGCGVSAAKLNVHPTAIGIAPAQPKVQSAAIAADIRHLAAQHYSVDRHIAGSLPNGTVFYVFHSICSGSADGHCQAVDAFLGGELTPRWHQQLAGDSAMWTTPGGFTVRVTPYQAADPLCCPSGTPATHVYRWNGRSFSELPPTTG